MGTGDMGWLGKCNGKQKARWGSPYRWEGGKGGWAFQDSLNRWGFKHVWLINLSIILMKWEAIVHEKH